MCMKLFLDTNVFIASLTYEAERGETATRLLNSDYEFHTSLINLMELRTVLAKKKRIEIDRVEEIEREIVTDVNLLVPDASDIMEANKIQRETLLYPLDAFILACAEERDTELATFDSEILENGGTHPDALV